MGLATHETIVYPAHYSIRASNVVRNNKKTNKGACMQLRLPHEDAEYLWEYATKKDDREHLYWQSSIKIDGTYSVDSKHRKAVKNAN